VAVSLSTDQLLTWLLLYGYPILFLAVLAASVGLPIPANLLLLAAGGFVAEGEFALLPTVLLILTAALLGDALTFGVVRWAGAAAVHRHGARLGLGPARLEEVRGRFGRWLGLSVFLTRWLFTPLSLPATVVAGASRYPVGAFALCAVTGETLWAGGYVGLGYLFGESWSGILDTVRESAGLLAGLGVAGGAGALLALTLRAQRASSPARE
jgi:membrane-associated protein